MRVNGSCGSITENTGVEWSSFNKLFSDHASKEDSAFGSERWASVYLASTPQQAAAMGLKFPGVDEVLISPKNPSYRNKYRLFYKAKNS